MLIFHWITASYIITEYYCLVVWNCIAICILYGWAGFLIAAVIWPRHIKLISGSRILLLLPGFKAVWALLYKIGKAFPTLPHIASKWRLLSECLLYMNKNNRDIIGWQAFPVNPSLLFCSNCYQVLLLYRRLGGLDLNNWHQCQHVLIVK